MVLRVGEEVLGEWQRGRLWLQASDASQVGSSPRFWCLGAARKQQHGYADCSDELTRPPKLVDPLTRPLQDTR